MIKKKYAVHNYGKYITTQEFSELKSDNFKVRLKQTNLTSKNHIVNSVKKTNFADKPKKFKCKSYFH